MPDNKKYYYLKLKETFFDSAEIKLIESQENGYIYYLTDAEWCSNIEIGFGLS